MSILECSEDQTYGKQGHICHLGPFEAKSFFYIFNDVKCHILQHDTFNCEENALEIYHCRDCDFKTELLIFFKKHIQQIHLRRNENGCASEICEYTLPSFVCQNCTFETYSSLHWLTHIKLGCPFEKKTQESDEQKILSTNSQGWYACKHCLYRTKNTKYLLAHVTRTHNENSFKCLDCDFTTHLKTSFRKHIVKRHLPSEKCLICDLCSFKAMSLSGLTRHKQNCLPSKKIKQFQCIHCPFNSKYKASILRHIVYKHKRDDEINWFKCDLCEYKSKLEVHLRYHVRRIHTAWNDTDLFHCDKCSYKTKYKVTLKRHNIRFHLQSVQLPSVEKQWFQCGKCSYKTSRKTDLNRHHRRKHTQIKDENHVKQEDYIS